MYINVFYVKKGCPELEERLVTFNFLAATDSAPHRLRSNMSSNADL